MPGESDLATLVLSMKPELQDGTYVFCTLFDALPTGLDPVMTFREAEGTTIIIEQWRADLLQIAYTYPCSWITLNVHSDLNAVGFTAVISQALADEGISCNVVAAYYHDHLFVAVADGERALKVLQALAGSATEN